MANIDRETITRQIRNAVDIVDVVSGYVSLRRAGANFKGLCPFHEEKTPSFTVHPGRQTFKCFGCGAGGDVFTFIQLKDKVEFAESRRILAERAGIPLERETTFDQSGPGKNDLVHVNQWGQKVFRRNYQGSAGELVRQYVAGRGISPASAEGFGLGLAVDSFDSLVRQAAADKVDIKLLVAAGLVKESAQGGYYDTFRHRLMFPIIDVNGRIVGFGGRALGDDPAKYLNTPATRLFDKSTHLFGIDRARKGITDVGRAIVVEGYTDCIMAHQFGFTETVATLGTAMTDHHANLLRRYTDRVVLVFDSDEAGQRAADRALAITISKGLDVSLARVPEGKDPCAYLLSGGKSGFSSVLKAGIGALEFKWQRVADEFNASATGPGRRRAIEEYLQQLSDWIGCGAIDPIQKGLLLNQLSKILSVPAEDLHRWFQGITRRSGPRSSPSSGVEQADSSGSSVDRPTSAAQRALRQIVEVLLNEPVYYASMADCFDPSMISDEALSAVGRELIAMIKSDQPFEIAELISRFESARYGRLITDLQVAGERRGTYSEVIEGAIRCLQSCERHCEAAALADAIRNRRLSSNHQAGEDLVPEGENEELLALADRARQPHFSTPKARKRFLGT